MRKAVGDSGLDPKSLVTGLRVAVLGCSVGRRACGHIHDLWTFRAGADGTGQGGGSGTSGPVSRPGHILIYLKEGDRH